MSHIELIRGSYIDRFNQPVPRYTSYPTAPEWTPTTPDCYVAHLRKLQGRPTSIYFHIPFCTTMCLYCACSVVLNRKDEKEVEYVDYLLKEIDLVTAQLDGPIQVRQLHFGGGTPTQLSEPLLAKIMDKVNSSFQLDMTGEISIEIDPRTVCEDEGKKLRFLKQLGFNRVSFGVQDTNWEVQEAVKRRQSLEVTEYTYYLARELGFDGINVDLIYGLPFQTPATFEKTVQDILQMRPDRIALFSYAKVPWLKPHQKAIKDETLPSPADKFTIYAQARQAFIDGGYTAIGMDHFALPTDALATAYEAKELQRNFQGYSLKLAEDLIGFGTTATGFVSRGYFQNLKELSTYYDAIGSGVIPVLRGHALSQDDAIRKWVIHRLMCDFELDYSRFEKEFAVPFETYFAHEQQALHRLCEEGLVEQMHKKLVPTTDGALFIRNLATTFDAYFKKKPAAQRFSQGV